VFELVVVMHHKKTFVNDEYFSIFEMRRMQLLLDVVDIKSVDDVMQAKESWEMDPPEKLEQSEISKNKGTDYFKARLYYTSTSPSCPHCLVRPRPYGARSICYGCWSVELTIRWQRRVDGMHSTSPQAALTNTPMTITCQILCTWLKTMAVHKEQRTDKQTDSILYIRRYHDCCLVTEPCH